MHKIIYISQEKLSNKIIRDWFIQDFYKYFNWKPEYELDKGLKNTFDWYKSFLEKYDYKDFN